MSENITKIYLLNVPLENDYKHTFYFADKNTQFNIMSGHIIKSYDNFTYQRKDNIIRIPDLYDNVIKANYVMYQNANFNNKWFYAFITDYEFKGEDQTNITIETDVIQTWLFDYNLRASFVEREHVNNDTIGLHTFPENLECGEAVCKQYNSDNELTKTHVVIGTNVDSNGDNVQGGNYNGIYSGVKYYSYESNDGWQLVNSFIKILEGEGKVDGIQCLFLAPEFLTVDEGGTLEIDFSNIVASYNYSLTAFESTYKPKNNKCLAFPYRYILASNNNGGSAIYKYEQFKDGVIDFAVKGALTPGCSIRLIPKNYNGVAVNNEEGLNLGKYPICNWNSDVFTNWLTQNSVNIGLNLASGVAQIVGGTALAIGSGGVAGAIGGTQIIGGVSAITQQLAQIHQMSFTPPQSHGNVNCGDVVTASKANTFHFYQMQIKDEYLKIIDEYLSMFGYKTNRVKVPNIAHRSNYWYTKTIDVNIQGTNVPANDLKKIKDCYNNGITFWKNFTYFKNYSVDNPII